MGAQPKAVTPLDLRFCGADDGIRTRDPHLGKAMHAVLNGSASSRLIRLRR
jgi:hypothetical protein